MHMSLICQVVFSIRIIFAAMLLALAGCATNVAIGQPQTFESSGAKEAIMAILKMHEANWNRHDMDAWAEMLHEDADWVNWRGGHWRGKAQIKAGHQTIHDTFYKSSRLSPQRVESLAFLSADMALAHVRGELSGDERAPGETFRYRKTILFTKINGVWGIRALHNTRLQAD